MCVNVSIVLRKKARRAHKITRRRALRVEFFRGRLVVGVAVGGRLGLLERVGALVALAHSVHNEEDEKNGGDEADDSAADDCGENARLEEECSETLFECATRQCGMRIVDGNASTVIAASRWRGSRLPVDGHSWRGCLPIHRSSCGRCRSSRCCVHECSRCWRGIPLKRLYM